MAKEKSVTVTQIRIEQDHAERQGIAHSALSGGRAGGVTRLALMFMIGASTGLVSRLTDNPLPSSRLRVALVLFYLATSIFNVWITQKTEQGEEKKAFWWPMFFTFFDAAFFLSMAVVDHTLG